MPSQTTKVTINSLLRAALALERQSGANLSMRQLSIFLISYLEAGPHTVRGLAVHLNIDKPAVTRALDRLSKSDLVRRKEDPADGRSIYVERTAKGAAFLGHLHSVLSDASTTASLARMQVQAG